MPTANKKNDNLVGMGGVFNPKNLFIYSYTFNNPINLIDPDGKKVRGLEKNLVIDPYTAGKLNALDIATPKMDYNIGGRTRTEERNKEIGGAKDSQHLERVSGTAVDVNPVPKSGSKMNLEDVAATAEEIGFTGVITYPAKKNVKKCIWTTAFRLKKRWIYW